MWRSATSSRRCISSGDKGRTAPGSCSALDSGKGEGGRNKEGGEEEHVIE